MSVLKKAIFFVIMVFWFSLTTMSSKGYCDGWVYVGSNKYYTIYYNSSSINIDKQNKIIKVWTKMVHTEMGKKVQLEGYSGTIQQKLADLKYYKVLELFDYKQMKYSIIHMTIYSNSGEVLLDGDVTPKWGHITPDTYEETLYNQILNDYNIKR